MVIKRKFGWLAAGLVLCLLASSSLPACSAQKTSLKIVTSFPMRGVTLGRSIVDAIELALVERNWQAGGRPIELVKLEGGNEKGQWDAAAEMRNIESAVSDKAVIAYIGPLHSAAARISIPIASRNGLLQISPSAGWPGLTKVGYAPGEPARFYPTGARTFYRTCPTDEVQAAAAVEWVKSSGLRRIYILDDGEAYGKGLADLFEQRAKAAGLTIRGHDSIDTTATNFIGVMSRLWLKPSPQLVYLSGYTPNGLVPLLKQMRTIKPEITSTVLSTMMIVDPVFVEGAGAQAEGVYIVQAGLPPEELVKGETGRAFVEAYQAKYGRLPGALAAYGYDAALVVLQALETAPTQDRAGVLKAIKTARTFKGVNGEFGFDQNGDSTLVAASSLQIKEGRFVFLQVLDTR